METLSTTHLLFLRAVARSKSKKELQRLRPGMSSEEVEMNISSSPESVLTRTSKRIAENFLVSAANEKLRSLDAHFLSDEDKEKVELLIASMIIDAEKLKCRYSYAKRDLMESFKTIDELTDKITEDEKSLEYSRSSEKALAEKIE